MENRTLIERYLAARNAGDRAKLAELVTDDLEYLVPSSLGVDPRYGETAVDALAGAAASRFFDLSAVDREATRITLGDGIVVVEERMTGPALNGKDYDNQYVWIFELREGKIARVIEHTDTLNVSRTLH